MLIPAQVVRMSVSMALAGIHPFPSVEWGDHSACLPRVLCALKGLTPGEVVSRPGTQALALCQQQDIWKHRPAGAGRREVQGRMLVLDQLEVGCLCAQGRPLQGACVKASGPSIPSSLA